MLNGIPNYVLKVFRANTSRPDICDMPLAEYVEPKLANCLKEFQKEAVYFGIEKQGRVLIADEMGLGKTYEALAIADFYSNDWPILIVTTAAMREVWATKIRELLPKVNPQRIYVMTGGQDTLEAPRVLITSYTLMEKSEINLIRMQFKVIIMDESHTVKSHKAKCTIVAGKLCKVAKRVILLSGTPALSRPKELFTQIEMLDPGFTSFREFSKRYCAGHDTKFGWNADGQSNLDELNVLLKKKYMIRRVKEDVMEDLTNKIRESVVLDTKLIADTHLQNEIKEISTKFSKTSGGARDEVLIQFYSATASIKVKPVLSYISELLKDSKIKFIVFAHHKVMLDALAEHLYQKGVDFIKIDGATRPDLRDKFVKRFQENHGCRAAVLSILACSAGITLTAANMVVFAELSWTPSVSSWMFWLKFMISNFNVLFFRF